MSHTADRLFPELTPGASLRWFVFLLGDGSLTRDPARAIATRRAGQFVRLWPKRIGAAFLLRPDLEPAPTRGQQVMLRAH